MLDNSLEETQWQLGTFHPQHAESSRVSSTFMDEIPVDSLKQLCWSYLHKCISFKYWTTASIGGCVEPQQHQNTRGKNNP